MKLLQNTYNWLFAARNERCEGRVARIRRVQAILEATSRMQCCTRHRAVMNALEQGIKTTLDLADATGIGLGGVYAALNRLEKRGLVWSEWDEASARYRGGNRRKYYYLTQEKIDYWEERMLWGRDGR